MNIQKAKREGRINWIMKMLEKIKEKEKTVDRDKTIAEIMIRFGVGRRVASEDLNACATYLRMK